MASFSPDDEVLSLSTTVGSEDDALRLARLLVAQRLAACVQVEAIHRSVYRWEGEVAEEPEWRLTAKTVPALRPALAELPVLVVSDAAAMLEQGAMINLRLEDGRIVFDVDLDAARRAGLAVSTKLLRLARYVRHQTTSP